MSKGLKWIGGGVLALAILISAGTFVYIHFIEGDAPKPLAFSNTAETATTIAGATTTTTSAGGNTATTATVTGDAGTWKATSASQVGYRVKEVLFGQSTEAVGRTNQVTGQLVATATSVQSVNLSVDMTSVKSDQSQRDGQFRGRIMETSTYPTATYKLAKPIALPASLGTTPVSVSATGDLTLHGTTKSVTTTLKVRRNGSNIEVNGTIPITFADYGVDNPSGGPATTEDTGQLELLVVFSR